MTEGRAAKLAEWLVESGYTSIVLDRLVEQARMMVEAESSSILVRDPRRPDVAVAAAGSGAGEELVGSRFAFKDGVVGPILSPAGQAGSTATDPCGAAGAESPFPVTVPIYRHGEVLGALATGAPEDTFGPRALAVLSGVAALAGVALANAERRGQALPIARARLYALVEVIDARDGYTAAHSEALAKRSRELGERFGLSMPDLIELELGALFHDLGKIDVPNAILLKPAPLDPEERALVRRHCDWGAEVLARVPGLEAVATIVRCHHERWDGKGYPEGLDGERIPLASRIVAVCDAYQAMTSDRPYRKALPHEQAMARLEAGAGTQFDPTVVELLAANGSWPTPGARSDDRRPSSV